MSKLLSISGLYAFYKLQTDLQKLQENKNSFNPTKLIQKLTLFLKSDDFIPFYISFKEEYLSLIIKLCESCEKYLFFKIMFPLLEGLKRANFEIQIKKEKQSILEEEEIINSYVNQNIEKIKEVLNSDVDEIHMTKVCNNLDGSIIKKYSNIFDAALKIIFGPCDDEKYIDFEKINFYNEAKKQLFNNFIDLSEHTDFIDLNSVFFNIDIKSLNYTKDLYQIINIILYNLQFEKNENEKYGKINKDSLCKMNLLYEDTIAELIMEKKLSENCFLLLLDKNKETEEYNLIILKGEKCENKKFSFNIYEIIEKRTKNDLINIYICQNIFTKRTEVVLQFNLEKDKNGDLSCNKIKENTDRETDKGDDLPLNLIKEKIDEEISQEIDEFYILIENEIIPYQKMKNSCLKKKQIKQF